MSVSHLLDHSSVCVSVRPSVCLSVSLPSLSLSLFLYLSIYLSISPSLTFYRFSFFPLSPSFLFHFLSHLDSLILFDRLLFTFIPSIYPLLSLFSYCFFLLLFPTCSCAPLSVLLIAPVTVAAICLRFRCMQFLIITSESW